jgi:glycosyltransferase involved in cell wall biosynthesis
MIGDNTFDNDSGIMDFIKDKNLENYVTSLGPQLDIEKYYKKFNIFILASKYEGCPNVLFEAMLSKCLCIISEGANSDHFIQNGINGLVYDGSDEMLELQIKQAFGMIMEGRANEIILNGYNYVVHNFSMGSMVQGYVKIYDKILKKEFN